MVLGIYTCVFVYVYLNMVLVSDNVFNTCRDNYVEILYKYSVYLNMFTVYPLLLLDIFVNTNTDHDSI